MKKWILLCFILLFTLCAGGNLQAQSITSEKITFPYYDDRTEPITHLVLHHFTLSVEDMLNTLHQYRLSVHYIIDENGHILQLVPEDKTAWHAGASYWHTLTGLNKHSIGIELQHSDFGQTPFTEAQIQALIPLVRQIIQTHGIRAENIVGHSDIAPDAKLDPGKAFPWHRLAQNGIGLWYNIKDAPKMERYDVAELLDIIGYPTKGRDLVSSAYAFRRRFLPEQVAYDAHILARGDAIFEARQKGAVPDDIPRIHPDDDGTFLTDPTFLEVLRAVAYRYQKARED